MFFLRGHFPFLAASIREALGAAGHSSSGPSASTNMYGSRLCEIIRFSSSMLAVVVTHGTCEAGPPKSPSPIPKVRFSASVKDDLREKPGAYGVDVCLPQYSSRFKSIGASSQFVIVSNVSVSEITSPLSSVFNH